MTIRVYPGAKNPTHQISLSDGVRTYGLRLEDGPRSVEEVPLTASTVHVTGGGSKFGDWEPGISHIEQRTWQGGRGSASFVDDPARYFDAKMAWTLTPGKLFPAPAWKFSNGYLDEVHENLPGDLGWRSLYGDYADIAEQFSHSNNWADYRRVYLWVRYVGSPRDLTVAILRDSSGAPSTAWASATISAADYPEHEVHLIGLDLDNANALVLTESWLAACQPLGDWGRCRRRHRLLPLPEEHLERRDLLAVLPGVLGGREAQIYLLRVQGCAVRRRPPQGRRGEQPVHQRRPRALHHGILDYDLGQQQKLDRGSMDWGVGQDHQGGRGGAGPAPDYGQHGSRADCQPGVRDHPGGE